MPDPQPLKPAPGPGGSTPTGALFSLLYRLSDDPAAAYTAVRETEAMAGNTVVQQLTGAIGTLRAEISASTASNHAAIQELRGEVSASTARTQTSIEQLRGEMNTSIGTLRAETEARFDEMHRQLRLIWIFLFSLLGIMATLLLRT